MYMTVWWFQFFRLRISRNGRMQHVRVQALQKIPPNRIDHGLCVKTAEQMGRPITYSKWLI